MWMNVKGGQGKGLNANVDDWSRRVLLALLRRPEARITMWGQHCKLSPGGEGWASRIETRRGEKK